MGGNQIGWICKEVNAEDTFEFSNGEFITKRTFWANKKNVYELIESKLDGKIDEKTV